MSRSRIRTAISNADWRNIAINSALVVCSLLISLAVSEYLVRKFTHFPIHSPISNRVTDERLLFRTSPNVHEVDRNGFRNPDSHASPFPRIAAVGDSQTYGYNVPRAATWPARLETALGEHVYNLGVGNYSYLNLVASAERALEFGAKVLVVGTHPINDLEICESAQLAYWTKRLSAAGPEGARVLEYCGVRSDDPGRPAYEILNRARKRGFYRRLRDQSALWSMLRYVKDVPLGLRDSFGGIRLAECASSDRDFVYRAGSLRDVIPHRNFGAPRRVRQLDEGVVKFALGEIARMAKAHDAAVYVLVIPSRPRVVVEYLKALDRGAETPDWLREIADYEARQISFVTKTARDLGLPIADATEETTNAYDRVTSAGDTFYPCSDSHPLADGYDAYAKVAQRLMQQGR